MIILFVCSIRHCQFVAAMAFVRRFCTSEMGHHRATRLISSSLTCTAYPSTSSHNSVFSGSIPISRRRDACMQHVYFTKLGPSTSQAGSGARCSDPRDDRSCQFSRSVSSSGRWHSLHWDRRETSLMCLNDSARCRSAALHPSEISSRDSESLTGDDGAKEEPPVLFSIERGTINHVLSTLTSSLPVQDGLKDVTATLRRLSATMHVQSIFETVAKPWDEAGSDDIIIRNKQPIESRSLGDITDNRPIRHHDLDYLNQPSNQWMIAQSTKFPVVQCGENAACKVGVIRRRHLYFNKVYHVPMLATVPEPSQLWASADIQQHDMAGGDSSLTEEERSMTPESNGDQKPSKEQILAMYERLVEQMPQFLNESHDFSMYANSVEFDNRIMKFKTKGLPAYRASVQGLKFLCTAYMTGSSMEVLRITAELDLGVIQARWRVRGVPLQSYIIRPWRRKQPDRYFDAFSTFELGTDGRIHRHTMDKVMPTPSDKVRAPSLATRIGIALGLVRNPALAPNCMVPKPLSFMQPKANAGKL